MAGTIQADNITNSAGTGAPNFPNGLSQGNSLFVSTAITTNSASISTNVATTFSNSPALNFTPTGTGKYRVYAMIPCSVTNSVAGIIAITNITNTSGGATLLYASQAILGTSAATVYGSMLCDAIYTLTAGTSYTFDIQGALNSGTGSITLDGTIVPSYLFAVKIA